MYIVFGYEIIDSEEIKNSINEHKKFKVLKDMSKATKREDILAFDVNIAIEELDKIINEDNAIVNLSEEELFYQYMITADKIGIELKEYMPQNAVMNIRAYKLDMSDNDVKLVIVAAHPEVGIYKVNDVTRRLLKQLG